MKKTMVLITFCLLLSVLPIDAAGTWIGQENQDKTGKSDTAAEIPVYGAIGSPKNGAMDIDGDGTADITLPEADLIEVSVTPAVAVNVYRDKTVKSVSAKCTIKNLNADNKLKVTMESLVAGNNTAKQIRITEDLNRYKEDGLNLSIYAKTDSRNAFAGSGQGKSLGQRAAGLAGTAKSSPVPITLGTLSEKGGRTPSGTYLFKADCKNAFIEKYQGRAINFQAIYKFTIQK